MFTLTLGQHELTMLHAAMRSYVDDFGHEEADVLRAAKAMLEKLEHAHSVDAVIEVSSN